MFKFIDTELLIGAWDGLKTHKLRSGLTTLGVIFGVAAVIGMASIGEGAKREALRQIELMGANNILVDAAISEEENRDPNTIERNPKGLTAADAEALQQVLGESVLVTPVMIAEIEARSISGKAKLNVIASNTNYFTLQKLNLSVGRALTEADNNAFKRVCVLGWKARRELYPLEDPIGRPVKIQGELFTVVGVVDQRLASGGEIEGFKLRDENRDIYLPLNTALILHLSDQGRTEITRIVIQLESPLHLTQYSGLIDRILDRRHRQAGDYRIIVPEQLLRQHQQTQRIFNIVMGAIASISLLVGGIGIMNIMLASVLERTREIGIRRAVGATQADITRQFLTEAALLSLIGGIIGVIIGVLLAKVISIYAGWETAVSGWAILTALGVSAGVGILFGYLPARRAAKLDPIMALRFE
ncbi:MAG: ABC transporter permease [Calditrichota bacterium]